MSDLTFNKIFGGVLLTGLVIFGLREASDIVFKKHEVEKPGYAIAVQEDTGGEGAAAAEVPPDWGSVLLLPANIEAGKAVSAKCASCHTFTSGGPNGTGPNLFGTLGKKPGTHPGFGYSGAMTDFGGKNPVWDYDHVDQFLKAPGKYISGTKMTFAGLKKQEDRIAVIAYLHSLGSTLPVPAPKPAAAAAPAADAAAAPAAEGAAAPVAGAPASAAATAPAPATADKPAAAPAKP
ncbi:cytochrome c family protein [Caulobacter flavus]|uniref:Cytochrome c family protein n=1 Tax=Caulobacter flavus TaxID=1679497 RepID=A0A2N5CYY5_9CAUL|nr:cytochrome c family protein [Caulobacter flavus]AYV45299.1 cytochrome c family protein [Caulobacter flavus]PLR19021.1 cytochrome c family protein [Caulobacter flavus]